jgi:hypothetical protein
MQGQSTRKLLLPVDKLFTLVVLLLAGFFLLVPFLQKVHSKTECKPRQIKVLVLYSLKR